MATATPGLEELDPLLASLNQLKPPGASKGKITTITALCLNNIKAESSIVLSFYRALKKAPATHKLGALYVIDSVVRQWIEKAKASGQGVSLEGAVEPGTYPSAVKRVTEYMPALLDDMIKNMPAEQKPKLVNMIAIWERGSTFPANMLSEYKAKLGATGNTHGASHVSAPSQSQGKPSADKYPAPIPSRVLFTPVGQPPRHLYTDGYLPGHKAPAPAAMPVPTQQPQQNAQAPQPPPLGALGTDVNSILAALSRAAQPVASAPAAPIPAQAAAPASVLPAQLPPELVALFTQQAQLQQQNAPAQAPPAYQAPPTYQAPPAYQAPPPYQAPPQFNGYPQPPPSIPQAQALAPPPAQSFQQSAGLDVLAPLRGLLPDRILSDQQKLIPALRLLEDLQKNGIPQDQWAPVLKAFEEQFQPAAPAYSSANNHARGRDRSRSPERGNRGRGSPVYGAYDADAARRQSEEERGGRNGGGRNRYRQRSPMRNSPAPIAMNGRPMQEKMVSFDPTLPPDSIKVLSRTLFVGGANGTQQEIQQLFERYGHVQTCIANRDKRHAFVKMTTHAFALAAKAGMEELQNRNDREVMNVARQTKWGVGFGPRECCDYSRGESIIPIQKLTDADRKWLLTAEFGGTGGRSVEGGMVIEEPDIEIGAGVSSKAMSKRVGPEHNQGGGRRQQKEGQRHGKMNRGGDHGYGGGNANGGYSQRPAETYAYVPRPEPVAVPTPPAVPGFGFSLSNTQGPYR